VSEVNAVSGQVVDAAFHIPYQLGPGLLESVYERILERSLRKRGLAVERQSRVGFEFEGERFDNAFRADLLVERCVLVEVKSVIELTPVYFMQVRTYLRLLNYPDVGDISAETGRGADDESTAQVLGRWSPQFR